MANKRQTRTPARKTAAKRNLGRYKSSLEKYCADQLAEHKIPFMYEEEEYVLIDGFSYDMTYWKMTQKSKVMSNMTNRKVLPIKYTPDFVGKDHNFVIETKGWTPSQHTFPIRWKLFLRYLKEGGDKLPALFMPKNKQQVDETIELIKQLIRDGEI